MSPPALGASSALDTIEALVVRLKFALALEVLRDWVRQLDAGEPSALDLLAQLLGEEQAARKTRRLRAASMTVRFTQIEILQSFDFSFQPSLNKRSCLRTGTNALHRTRRSCPSPRLTRHRKLTWPPLWALRPSRRARAYSSLP